MPDIILTSVMKSVAKLIEYVTRKYGQERRSQIISTFGTEAARAVIRDVGQKRLYHWKEPYKQMIPNELGLP